MCRTAKSAVRAVDVMSTLRNLIRDEEVSVEVLSEPIRGKTYRRGVSVP